MALDGINPFEYIPIGLMMLISCIMFILEYFDLFKNISKMVITIFTGLMLFISGILLIFSFNREKNTIDKINNVNSNKLLEKLEKLEITPDESIGINESFLNIMKPMLKNLKNDEDLKEFFDSLIKKIIKIALVFENVYLFLGSIFFSIGTINLYPSLADTLFDLASYFMFIIVLILLAITGIHISSILTRKNGDNVNSLQKFTNYIFKESRINLILNICFYLSIPCLFLILFNQNRGEVMKLITDVIYIIIIIGLSLLTLFMGYTFAPSENKFKIEFKEELNKALDQVSSMTGGKRRVRRAK